MKFISLFAGIGGFDLGLERAGMQCVGQVEINPFCQQVLGKHWPTIKRIGDIRNVTAESFGSVDLICGGFPCQPFSSAGKRRGKYDTRFLWPEMLRVIEAYRPAWVLGENVIGIVKMALGEICAGLEEKGYICQPFVIPACAVGAPHQRERVWIVARDASVAGATTPGGVCERAHSNCYRSIEIEGFWNRNTQPEMGGVVHGVSRRLDRITALGNAVVPQVVEVIGTAIRRAHIVCAECAPENTSEARLTAYNSRVTQGAKAHIAEAATS
jgi:DNA (cytosine-5)-methyltransferase 1